MEAGKGLKPADLKEYVDIHGQTVRVEVSPSGEYLVLLSEVKRAGFSIYLKSQYNKLLIDESDFTHEFENHMLGAAKTWCLSNKHSFSSHEIVQSIENAKKILLSEHSKQAKAADPARSEFLKERSVAEQTDFNIQITKTVSGYSPKPTTPSQAPQHSTVPVRPLTSQNLQLHNEQKTSSPPVNFSNGIGTPPAKDASDGNSFEGKGNFQGRRSFEQNHNYQRNSADNNGQFNQRRSGGAGDRNPDASSQYGQRRSGGAGDRNPDTSSQYGQRRSGGDNNGSFNQRNADNQYGQRKSGGGGGDFNQRNADNQPYQRRSSDDFESTPSPRQPHQRPDNQSMPKMPQKGAFNRAPSKGGDFVPKVEMDMGENEVVVTLVQPPTADKPNVTIWVQRLSDLPLLASITEKVNSHERTQKPVQPLMHKVYMAKFEGDWYRCRVCGLDPTRVFFLDYGNQAVVDEVKPLPAELVKMPQQVIRVSLVDDDGPLPKVEDEITLIVEKVYSNTNVHVAKVKRDATSMMSKMSLSNSSPQSRYQQEPSPPKQQQKSSSPMVPARPPAFFGMPPPVVQIRSEMMVKLLDEQLGCFYVLTKECVDEQKAISAEINQITLKPLESVSTDQLVLCRRPHVDDVCRAVVLKVFGATVKVQLLDFPGLYDLPSDSFMAITESLSKKRTTLLKSPQIVCYTKPFGGETKKLLQKLINEKTKLKTLLLPSGKFDLVILETGDLLSQMIQHLESPPPPSKSNRIMFRDFKKVKLCCESNQPFLCSTFVSMDDVTIIHQTDELIGLIEQVLKNELDDNTPYAPIVDEVCLGYYEESWYRCAVTGVRGNSYSVLFIDFGNEVVLKSEELRKLTEDLYDIPILGCKARLTGIPRNAEIENTLREQVVDEINNMNIISFTDGKYNIEIPEIYRQLEA